MGQTRKWDFALGSFMHHRSLVTHLLEASLPPARKGTRVMRTLGLPLMDGLGGVSLALVSFSSSPPAETMTFPLAIMSLIGEALFWLIRAVDLVEKAA